MSQSTGEGITLSVTDYVRVVDRASALGCPMPTGFAVLPVNFASASNREAFLFNSEAATVKTLLRNEGVDVGNFLPAAERVPSVHNKHFDWAPTIFISAALLSQHPDLVSLALNVVANYVTDFFRGFSDRKVKLQIVVETKGDRSCKIINFEGGADGMRQLPDIIQRIGDGKHD